MKGPGRLKAAFLIPANLIALASAGVASAVTGEPAAALVALGVEAFYLGLHAVSGKGRGGDHLEGHREIEALLDELAPSQREHYLFLRELRDKILANYQKLPGGGVLVAGSERQVDSLLTAFLRLLVTLNGYRKYLNATDRKTIERELTGLDAEVTAEENPRLKEVKAKRADILRKRLQRFQQADESRELISHQLAGIEDLLRLTHEQSIAIRDPGSVSRQLDALSAEVQATETTVRELETFLEFAEETAPQLPHGVRVR